MIYQLWRNLILERKDIFDSNNGFQTVKDEFKPVILTSQG